MFKYQPDQPTEGTYEYSLQRKAVFRSYQKEKSKKLLL